MLRQLRTGGGGLASSAAVAAAATQAMRESAIRDYQSLAATAAACGNLRLLFRHLSADASPSSSSSSGGSGSPSSSSVAEDPRWKSPLFDALLSLAARATSSSPTTTSSTPPTSAAPSSSSSPPLPPPLRSVVAERHGLLDFIFDGARTAQARMLAHFIRTNVETSFDDAEFLEGAADARHAVFDALSEEGDLAPLRGAVAPGLLRALHGLKEMHAAAGLAVRLTAAEDAGGGGGGSDGAGASAPFLASARAELGAMGLLDPPLFEAMSRAVPGFEDLPSISREIEEKIAAESSSSGGSSGGSGGGGGGGGGAHRRQQPVPADDQRGAAGGPDVPVCQGLHHPRGLASRGDVAAEHSQDAWLEDGVGLAQGGLELGQVGVVVVVVVVLHRKERREFFVFKQERVVKKKKKAIEGERKPSSLVFDLVRWAFRLSQGISRETCVSSLRCRRSGAFHAFD